MVRKEILELKEILEKEKVALMKGAVEEILKWASYKARLASVIKERDLTPEEKVIIEEIKKINERNKMMIEAGLRFVEEAYKILTEMITRPETYGKVTNNTPRMLSKSV